MGKLKVVEYMSRHASEKLSSAHNLFGGLHQRERKQDTFNTQ